MPSFEKLENMLLWGVVEKYQNLLRDRAIENGLDPRKAYKVLEDLLETHL